MRVLFIYKYLTLGGVEAVLRTRIEELGHWGIEAHAWFFHDLGGRNMFADLPADRIHVGEVAACADFIGQEAFDVVSSIDTEEIFPCFVTNRGLSRLVVEAHSAYPPSLGYLSDLAELRPDAVFVPSAYHGSMIRERIGPGVEIRLVLNPVHSLFLSEPAGCDVSPVRPVLAWVGRLDEFKNWPTFLEATGILLREGWDLEAWVVGRPVGPGGGEDLMREAKRVGVLERLRWYRGLPHSTMPALFDAVCDSGGVVVTTSRGESFGLTVAEAMARRCAVVVPREGPFQEYVEHERSGLCYDSKTAASVAEQVSRLLTDVRFLASCGAEARDVIVARHSPARTIGLLAKELGRVAGWEPHCADVGLCVGLPAGEEPVHSLPQSLP